MSPDILRKYLLITFSHAEHRMVSQTEGGKRRRFTFFLFHMLLRCVPDTEKSLPQHEAVVHPKTTIPYVTDRIQESFKGNKVVMKSTEMRGFHSLCPEGFRFI